MKKKRITIEDLARMVQKGFEETAKKDDADNLRTDLNSLRTEMNERFDKIERLILADHKRRIEKLEQDMRELKNALAI
ncbi:MAG: hypothetical protein HYV54_01815 [Parcubacteria group bacterium]|nr:hypothetical protein [Parcubacteria group bacterium]